MKSNKQFLGRISYMIVKDLYQHKELDQLECSDIYTNNYGYSFDYMAEYIKSDLISVITNNGSYKDHIMILDITIKEVI